MFKNLNELNDRQSFVQLNETFHTAKLSDAELLFRHLTLISRIGKSYSSEK